MHSNMDNKTSDPERWKFFRMVYSIPNNVPAQFWHDMKSNKRIQYAQINFVKLQKCVQSVDESQYDEE